MVSSKKSPLESNSTGTVPVPMALSNTVAETRRPPVVRVSFTPSVSDPENGPDACGTSLSRHSAKKTTNARLTPRKRQSSRTQSSRTYCASPIIPI